MPQPCGQELCITDVPEPTSASAGVVGDHAVLLGFPLLLKFFEVEARFPESLKEKAAGPRD